MTCACICHCSDNFVPYLNARQHSIHRENVNPERVTTYCLTRDLLCQLTRQAQLVDNVHVGFLDC